MADIPVERKQSSLWWLWLLLAALAIGALIWLLIAFFNDRDTARPAAPVNATLAEIVNNPRNYYGKTVTVSGEITDVVSTNALTLGDRVLVLSSQPFRDGRGQPLQPSVAGRDTLQVTGTVREFDLLAIERDMRIDLEDAKFARWKDQPAIIATSTQMKPR